MLRRASPLLLCTMLLAAACGRTEVPARSAVGRWSIDRPALRRALDDARTKLGRDMEAKVAAVPESERATAVRVGEFAATMLSSFEDLDLSLEVEADGTFAMTGVAPIGHAPEHGSGTWVDRDGAVVFTVLRKNGTAADGSTGPMRFTWKDADTLVMSVPKLDAGIALTRR